MCSVIVNDAKTYKWYDFDKSLDCMFNPVGEWLDAHPFVNKVVVVANHFFRAVAMHTFMCFLPLSLLINFTVGLAGSLFYRMTIERFCHFRFALPSFLGAIAFSISYNLLQTVMRRVALNSFKFMAYAFITALPLVQYIGYVLVITHQAVEKMNDNQKEAKKKKMQEDKDPSSNSCCCDV
jgi:hypothetical protein